MRRALLFSAMVLGISPVLRHFLVGYPPELRMLDLSVYLMAGDSVLTGGSVFGARSPVHGWPFIAPPFTALLMAPLAALPLTVAQWIWAILILLPALALIVRYSFGPLLRRKPLLIVPIVVGAVWLFGPVVESFRFGQIAILLTLLCLADCLSPSPRWPRGMLIGLAAAIKLFPAVFIIYLLLTGRRTAALVAIATATGATVATIVLLPRDSWDFWTDRIFWSQGSNGPRIDNMSLQGMLGNLGLDGLPLASVWLAAVAVVCAGGFAAARRAHRRGSELAAVAMVGLISVLVSPVTWMHYITWALVGMGALIGDGRDRKRVAWAAVIGFLYLPVFWLHLPAAAALGLPAQAAWAGYGAGAFVVFLLVQCQAKVAHHSFGEPLGSGTAGEGRSHGEAELVGDRRGG